MVNEENVKCVERTGKEIHLEIDGPATMSMEEVYDAYAPLLFGYILKIVDHKDDAESVLVSVFVDFSQNRNRYYDSPGVLFISLLNRARNESIDTLIKRNRDKLIASSPNETNCIFIQELPLFEKTILALIYFKRFGVNEVADFLQIPVKNILDKLGAYQSAANPS